MPFIIALIDSENFVKINSHWRHFNRSLLKEIYILRMFTLAFPIRSARVSSTAIRIIHSST